MSESEGTSALPIAFIVHLDIGQYLITKTLPDYENLTKNTLLGAITSCCIPQSIAYSIAAVTATVVLVSIDCGRRVTGPIAAHNRYVRKQVAREQ